MSWRPVAHYGPPRFEAVKPLRDRAFLFCYCCTSKVGLQQSGLEPYNTQSTGRHGSKTREKDMASRVPLPHPVHGTTDTSGMPTQKRRDRDREREHRQVGAHRETKRVAQVEATPTTKTPSSTERKIRHPTRLTAPVPQHHLPPPSELAEHVERQHQGHVALGIAAKRHPHLQRLRRKRHVAAACSAPNNQTEHVGQL